MNAVWLPNRPRRSVCLRSDRWSRQAVCSSCTKGIRHGIEIGRRPASAPADGVVLLALTFGTLLSSQGAGAHRYWVSRPVSGQLAKRYSAGFAVSNPEVCPAPPAHHSWPAESADSEGWEPVPLGDRPAFGAWNTVGGRWLRSQIRCRRSPGPRSGAIVDSRQR